MFQAYKRGWRRWAAGLVLVPGLTLGATSLAIGQDRPATAKKSAQADELMRQAREAHAAKNYGQAEELARKARALRGEAAFYEESTEPSAKPKTKPTSTDAKVLVAQAKSALDAGDLDAAQDLATQAQAHGGGVRWGLFDDTPASLLKDVQKARGRKAREQCDKLLADARTACTAPWETKAERARNLGIAEEKAKQAAALNGTYNLWDFSDRPEDVLADVKKIRDKERIPATKVAEVAVTSDELMPETPAVKPETATKKKLAVALMQEGKALEIGKDYVGAQKKYAAAAKLNAVFEKEEGSPEAELARLNVAAQRKMHYCVEEARSCIEKKDKKSAEAYLAEAEMLAKGMGLDASAVADARDRMDPPAPVIHRGTRPLPEAGDAPMPIIRTGRRSLEEPDMPVITPVGGEQAPVEPIPTTKGGPAIQPIPTGKKVELPPVPDIDLDAVEPPPSDPVEAGTKLLKAARMELQKGDTEAASKLVVKVINDPKMAKLHDQAEALVRSIDVKENERKIDSSRRAFENGMKAYHGHDYAQALSIFKQIDGSLLPPATKKELSAMTAAAESKLAEVDAARALRNGGEPLPAAPKKLSGTPDLPAIPTSMAKTGPDNLVQQQEALAQVEFQKLRNRALKVESEATNRFGRGETDAALQDLSNFIVEVKSSTLDAGKKNLLTRPIEARMDRLKVLKHQTDFLTKEARDKRDFKANMTQEALHRQDTQKRIAELMTAANKLHAEAKYSEAYAKMEMAHQMDPDDPTLNAAMQMTHTAMRSQKFKDAKASQEAMNFELGNQLFERPKGITDDDPLRWHDSKEYRDRVMKRMGSGSVGTMRSRSEADKSIERKMGTPISVNFKGVGIDSVVDQLHTMTGINFDLDRRNLEVGSIDLKTPITANLKDVSLKSALNIICQQAGLTHIIENESIRVTTPKGASGRQSVRSMSVGDLVIPAPNYGGDNLSLKEQLRKATDAAFGHKNSMESTLKTGPAPGGSPIGLPGSPGRLTGQPMDGGVQTNSNGTGSTLEKELIRLITTTIKPDSWSGLGGEGTIEYFPLGMALVINQSPEVIEEVERLLESLRKLQDLEVSIEVKVVSLAETFFERIGVDFNMGLPTNAKPSGGPAGGQTVTAANGTNFTGNVVGLQTPGVPTPDLDIPIRATSFARAIPPFGGFSNTFADGGISLGLAFLSDIQVQMFLEAAQGDTRTNVMQAPKLTALNGTSASLTVGDFQFFNIGITPVQVNGQLVFVPQNVPFAVGITQPIPPNASIQNGLINFTPTQPQTPGLGLFIQPVVSADRRFVRLNIQQSFTSLISGTQQIPITTVITPVFDNGGQGQPIPFTQFLQQPRFSNLDTQTVVVVPDGGTVVMGGLKYLTEGRNEFGPPVLSKIPYLNRLFKNVAYGREGRSILIMVTPRVIINREEQERQTGVRDDDFIGGVGPIGGGQ